MAPLTGQRALASPGAHFPRRVMSISLCTDQLLLDLLPPSRITSVTYLSRQSNESYLSAEAWKVPVNYGTAEEIVQERPDLVLAGAYTTAPARQLLKAVGIRTMVLPPANNFQDIRNQTLQVGHALGADAQAERLVRKMEATLAQLAATAPKYPVTILGLDGAGVAYGRGTLFDAIVSAAGAVNLDTYAGYRRASYDTEQLL
ncbi:MAG: ABC transporter substrate-binding protein, partial [Acetobacteraceae bacterium]